MNIEGIDYMDTLKCIPWWAMRRCCKCHMRWGSCVCKVVQAAGYTVQIPNGPVPLPTEQLIAEADAHATTIKITTE